MAIKRYYASADNTITNAFESNLTTRGTGSNMGLADILEVFSIYGQESSGSQELSRVLIQFDLSGAANTIKVDRNNGVLPAQNEVSFYLRTFNAEHSKTLPKDAVLVVQAVTGAWFEGRGLNMENYTDIGKCNWVSASSTTAWATTGSDYHALAAVNNFSGSVTFVKGNEDLELEVTPAVVNWLDGTKTNYGFLLKQTQAAITGSSGSLFTKMFHGRSTEFVMQKPVIEARWDDSRKDQRGSFILSSSVLSSENNLNTLYLYNRFRGTLTDILGLSENRLSVAFYTASSDGAPIGVRAIVTDITGAATTAVEAGKLIENGNEITGIYTASFATTSSFSELNDVWHSGSTEFFTGSFKPASYKLLLEDRTEPYMSKITNLSSLYSTDDKPVFRVFVRPKRWQPTIYSVASVEIENTIIEDAYYKVFRIEDNLEVIPFGTGTTNHTRMSYDVSGNYFELDMEPFESGFNY
ncbi:MAG TPA: hypothetical protein DCM40_05195, partial [Maribacter sp.]|nr:hypothetical protein [Maribacter sp.]